MRRFRFHISDLLVLVIVSALCFASYRLMEMLGLCFFLIAVQLSLNSLASARGCFRADRPVWTAFALAGWVGFPLECSFLAARPPTPSLYFSSKSGFSRPPPFPLISLGAARRENRRPSQQTLPNEDIDSRHFREPRRGPRCPFTGFLTMG